MVVHIDGGVAQRRDPGRAAVLRAVAAAGAPADHCLGRQPLERHEREAPVVGCAVAGLRATSFDDKEVCSAGVLEERAGVLRQLPLQESVAAAGNRQRAAPRTRGVVDGHRRRVGTIQKGIGLVAVGRRTNSRQVLAVPERGGPQNIRAGFVRHALVAGHHVHLDRLGARNRGALLDAAVDLIGFAAVQHDARGCHRAGPVGVDRHRGVVLVGHDQQSDVLEHVVEGDVLAYRHDVVAVVIHGREHFHRACLHRPHILGPAGAGDGDGLVGADAVTGIVEDGGWIARQSHVVAQREHCAGRKAVWVVRETRRNAVGVVAVAPDLRGGLNRMGDVRLVAVLPLVIGDDSAVARDHDRENRRHDVAGGRPDCRESRPDLLLGHGQEELLHHRRCETGFANKKKQTQNLCHDYPTANTIPHALSHVCSPLICESVSREKNPGIQPRLAYLFNSKSIMIRKECQCQLLGNGWICCSETL